MPTRVGVGVDPVDGDKAARTASKVLAGEEEGGTALSEFPVQQKDTDVPVVNRDQRDMAVTLLEKLSISLPTATNRIDLVRCAHAVGLSAVFSCFLVLLLCCLAIQ